MRIFLRVYPDQGMRGTRRNKDLNMIGTAKKDLISYLVLSDEQLLNLPFIMMGRKEPSLQPSISPIGMAVISPSPDSFQKYVISRLPEKTTAKLKNFKNDTFV